MLKIPWNKKLGGGGRGYEVDSVVHTKDYTLKRVSSYKSIFIEIKKKKNKIKNYNPSQL